MIKKSLKESETQKNLMLSFATESQARNRYTYYASVAKKEGYQQIYNIFLDTACNEKEHAEIFFEYLEGEPITVTGNYITKIGDTKENLEAAISGEHEENSKLYPNFAEIAEKEGYHDVAESFKHIAQAEKHHEYRFKKLLENIEKGQVFKRDTEVEWVCLNCGFRTKSKEAPKKCPSCKHPQDFFELWCQNY